MRMTTLGFFGLATDRFQAEIAERLEVLAGASMEECQGSCKLCGGLAFDGLDLPVRCPMSKYRLNGLVPCLIPKRQYFGRGLSLQQ